MFILKTFIKKHLCSYVILLVFCLCSRSSFSNYPISDTTFKPTKHGLSLQLGGAQIIGSIQYENVLKYTANNKIVGRLGLGGLFSLIIPTVGFSALFGQTNHLEIGVDAGPVFVSDGDSESSIVSPLLGYRYQNFKKNSCFFTVGFSPLIIRNFDSNSEFSIFPFGKIGLGFNF